MVGRGYDVVAGVALTVGAVGEVPKLRKLLPSAGCLESARDELNLVPAMGEGVLESLSGTL